MRNRFLILALVATLAGLLAVPVNAAPQGQGNGAYLIGTDAPLTAAQMQDLRDAGANVVHVYENFGGASARINPRDVDRIRELPFVTSVNPDTIKELDSVIVEGVAPSPATSDTLPGMPYWHDLIDLENNGGYTGEDVWVAVLDSGFYPNWRDYFAEDSILTQHARAFNAAGAHENPNQWDTGSDPHAMAVAATIAGYRFADDTNEGGWGEGFATGAAGAYWVPGVAPDAKIIPIKVCEPIGCFGSAINAAIDYVTSLKKAHPDQPIVINESLGGPRLDPTEKAAIDAAIEAGVVIVASAGNSGESGMGFPAAYEPVISVGAGAWTQQWNEFPDKTWWLDDVPENLNEIFLVNFSSRALVESGQYLDVVSTGRFLLLPYPCAQLYKNGQISNGTIHRTCASKATPDNSSAAPFQYLFMSGTSFSAPTMSGIVALMLDKNSGLNNADATFGSFDPSSWGPGSLELLLEDSATPMADSGSVTVTYRTGEMVMNTWRTHDADGNLVWDTVGHGWVFVDDALAATPSQ